MLSMLVFLLILASSFLFAMLGLGGGMVYVPILKWAGLDYKTVVIPLGLLLNGLNTLLALIPYHRSRLVDYHGAWPMGVAAMLFAPLGALTTAYVPKDTLVVLFAVAVLAAAFKVLWDLHKAWSPATQAATDTATTLESQVVGIRAENGFPRLSRQSRRMVWSGSAGAFIGFIGGMLGVGGGFVVGPLLMSMGYPPKQAAATTAFVVTFSSFSGYLGHTLGGHTFNGVTILTILAVILGSQAGGYFMAHKAKPQWVKLIYGIVLVMIAVKLMLEAI